jgi:AcrR family transcriptional regulator
MPPRHPARPSTARPSTARPEAAGRNGARIRRPRIDPEERRARFLRAAARAFLEHGIAASMQDIAESAGAQKVAFYRIFPSRSALMDALMQNIHDAFVLTYRAPWGGYGSRMRAIYEFARQERDIFVVGLKTFRGAPELKVWRRRIGDIVHMGTLDLFVPGPNAPKGADRRALKAAQTLSSLTQDTLVSWLEDEDGLSDANRILWWSNFMREWHRITRIVFELDAPLALARSELAIPQVDG